METPQGPTPAQGQPPNSQVPLANREEAEREADQILGTARHSDGDEYKHAADEVSGLIGGRHMGSRWIAHGEATLPIEEAETADNVAGEEAVMGDEDRVAVERDASIIASANPSSALQAEAEQIKAEVENDANDAINAGLKLSQVATHAAKEKKRHRLLGFASRSNRKLTVEEDPALVGALGDEKSAQSLLDEVSHDLADADNARKKLEDDMKAAGLTPDSSSGPPSHH